MAAAESSGLRAASVDLVTVATSVHWFRFDDFYAEVARVRKPGGVLAVWGYHVPHVTEEIDEHMRALYQLVEPYFPPPFRYLTERYQTMPFPRNEIASPALSMSLDWDLDALLGFMESWSGVRGYTEAHGEDPVAALEPTLARHWGDRTQRRTVTWDLPLRIAMFEA